MSQSNITRKSLARSLGIHPRTLRQLTQDHLVEGEDYRHGSPVLYYPAGIKKLEAATGTHVPALVGSAGNATEKPPEKKRGWTPGAH